MDGHPLATIPPQLALPKEVDHDQIDPAEIVTGWLNALGKYLGGGQSRDLSALFIDDCWWRDMVGLSWDVHSKHGLTSIEQYLHSSSLGLSQLTIIKDGGGLRPSLVNLGGGLSWIQGGFTFQTAAGSGTGFVRLVHVADSQWKAWMAYTQLERLKTQDEIDQRRLQQSYTQTQVPNGVNGVNGNEELQVLIIGAGQSGLALAAQLKHMGLKPVLVDQLPRVGDFWRSRYDTVKMHTTTYTDHYPFLKYPTNFPRWLARDTIADWLEHYSQIMDLEVRLSTRVTDVSYDHETRRYSVQVETVNGQHQRQTLRVRHVVLANGLFSPVPIVPKFVNQDKFRGQLYHSVEHRAARLIPDLVTKNVVIVGTGTSAHDIAQDFVNAGARAVSMIQRKPIFSFSAQTAEASMYSPWNTPGVTTEEADIIGNSFPIAVARTFNAGQTQMMESQDKDLIEGLERAGMAIKKSTDVGYGLLDQQLISIGSFYLDQGASQMIVDGRIAVHRCDDGIREFVEDGLVLANSTNTHVPADIIVLATGFYRNNQNLEQVMGKKVAEKIGDFGFLDEEQERIGWWRPTGVPAFWFMTGSFIWSRPYSRVLALQIAAVENGFNPGHYDEHERLTKGLGSMSLGG